MSIALLVLLSTNPERLERLRKAGFDVIYAPTDEERDAAIAKHASTIRAVLTNGSNGLTAQAIAALPKVEIICSQGAGYEKVDVAAARARGIPVTNGRGTNDSAVADHAMALLLGIVRNLAVADALARVGDWGEAARKIRPQVSGKRLGILGLGTIGEKIATRGAHGFEMEVAYYNRREREGSPWQYMSSLKALAEWADFLVVATPGGADTKHLVNAEILDALGPKGFLVNIARGSVVDTKALIHALQQERIAGAGLDVVEGEPVMPPELAPLKNLLLTPHVAGRSPEATAATLDLVIRNLQAHFDGKPLITPV